MITDVEYMRIITENYDLSDYKAKKELIYCNEAKKVVNIEYVVNRLYQHIKSNCTGIDFGTIPKSKGVVTRIDNYTQLVDCIDAIHDLVKTYNNSTATIDTVSTALANIQERERLFTKAFALNIEFPIMIYNSTVLSIVSAVSLLISSSVEFIKNGHDSFNVAFDKIGYTKSQEHLLYEYMNQFNSNCKNGTMDKLINECIKNNITATNEAGEIVNEDAFDTIKNGIEIAGSLGSLAGVAKAYGKLKDSGKFSGALKFVTIVVGIGVAIYALIKIMAMTTRFLLNTKMKVSDWFEAQSEFLRINAENLKYRDDPKGDDHKQAVYQSQMKWVEKFKKISNNLAIKDSKARKQTEDEERKSGYDDDDSSDDEDDGGLF